MRRLTDAEKALVEAHLVHIPDLLSLPIMRSYVALLGRDDARQEAAYGMMIAATKWKADRGKPFKSYAAWWIRSRLGKVCQRNGLMRDPDRPVGSRPGPRKLERLEGDDRPSRTLGPDEQAMVKELIEQCGRKLGPTLRNVVWMVAQGYGFPEIARRIGYNRKAGRSRQRAQQLYQEARQVLINDEYLRRHLESDHKRAA